MKKGVVFCIIGLFLLSGCSKKMPISLPSHGVTQTQQEEIINDESQNKFNSATVDNSLVHKNGSVYKKGAVSSTGKYLGNEGLSKSGFKNIYFATDSYTVEPDQLKRLMSDLPKIKDATTQGKIIVEGNCDEFGTDEYNHALGLKRAKAVKKLLVSGGIDPNKIDIVSYGESNPVCTVNAPACHAKNRRVEINKL